jgi:hypothetical protein
LLIDGFKEIYCGDEHDMHPAFGFCKAVKIINKWLKEPMSKQRMIDCQNELIDAELDDFAQL